MAWIDDMLTTCPRLEQIIDVNMARPRGFDGRKNPRFHEINDAITEIFLARGVLQRGAA